MGACLFFILQSPCLPPPSAEETLRAAQVCLPPWCLFGFFLGIQKEARDQRRAESSRPTKSEKDGGWDDKPSLPYFMKKTRIFSNFPPFIRKL